MSAGAGRVPTTGRVEGVGGVTGAGGSTGTGTGAGGGVGGIVGGLPCSINARSACSAATSIPSFARSGFLLQFSERIT
jgi:hypothetical protein